MLKTLSFGGEDAFDFMKTFWSQNVEKGLNSDQI